MPFLLKQPKSKVKYKDLTPILLRGREGIGRVFYCFIIGQRIVILHGFIKKTEETPERELRIARRRMKEVKNG